MKLPLLSGKFLVCISITLGLVVFPCLQSIAQRVIFKKDVIEQVKRVYEDSTGPNGKIFCHAFLGLGMIIPVNESDSAAISENGKSNQFYFGFREKFKLNNTFALNLELIYIHQKFHIRQDEKINIFSPGIIQDVQKFNTNSIGLGGSLRINYGKRGNVIGRYIDLGGDFGYVFSNRIYTRNKVAASTNGGAEKIKSSLHKLDFVNPLIYFVNARIGFNHFAFFARYRVNDQFKKSDNFYAIGLVPELPRISIGLEIALYE
ncbi:MAG: outer membrane beta-barrel protein [Flavobacteriales bacterium]